MLTDAGLKQLKPKGKPFKVSDRDGMYAHVSASGTVTFRYDYRLNGRRETVVLGRFGPKGITLAIAREKCLDARRRDLFARFQEGMLRRYAKFAYKFGRGIPKRQTVILAKLNLTIERASMGIALDVSPADLTFVRQLQFDFTCSLLEGAG